MPNYDFLEKLENYIEEILKAKDRVLISVVGKNGTGKSYFGRYVRKKGIGKFDKKAIVVIDDRTLILGFLGFFRKRIKIPNYGVDELEPYLKKLPESKKIIFYINKTPINKITKADILLKLSTDEVTRRRRLEERYKSNPEKLKKYLNEHEIDDYHIQYTFLLHAAV